MKRHVLIALAAIAVTACGHAAIPSDRLGQAEGAVRTAHALGASQEPSAALHLRLANENLAKGKELMAKGDNERASYMLLRAAADAELAKSLVNEARAKAQASRAQHEIQMMQSSMRQGS